MNLIERFGEFKYCFCIVEGVLLQLQPVHHLGDRAPGLPVQQLLSKRLQEVCPQGEREGEKRERERKRKKEKDVDREREIE